MIGMKNKVLQKMISEEELPKTFLRFYFVGLLLFIIPYTRELFFSITAFTLILVIACILFHHKEWNKSTVLVFAFIAFSSFFLEVAGVNLGVLFGEYQYDISLGLKLWNTPLIIGLNWVFLVYASQSIISRFTNNAYLRIVGGASLMIGYDLILELAAPPMQMWHFKTFYPPVENFVTWFVAALFYHTLLVSFKISADNKSAGALFGIQMLFFAIISIFSLLFIQ